MADIRHTMIVLCIIEVGKIMFLITVHSIPLNSFKYTHLILRVPYGTTIFSTAICISVSNLYLKIKYTSNTSVVISFASV